METLAVLWMKLCVLCAGRQPGPSEPPVLSRQNNSELEQYTVQEQYIEISRYKYVKRKLFVRLIREYCFSF
jgi:hypothetical protein